MKIRTFLKPVTLFSCLWVSISSVFPVTAQAGSVYSSSGRYSEGNRGYDRYQDYDRNRDRRSNNYTPINRAVDFYYGGNRGRNNNYNRGYQPSNAYCPDNAYSGYRDRGRRDYQRPRGFGIFYYGKQR